MNPSRSASSSCDRTTHHGTTGCPQMAERNHTRLCDRPHHSRMVLLNSPNTDQRPCACGTPGEALFPRPQTGLGGSDIDDWRSIGHMPITCIYSATVSPAAVADTCSDATRAHAGQSESARGAVPVAGYRTCKPATACVRVTPLPRSSAGYRWQSLLPAPCPSRSACPRRHALGSCRADS